MTASRPPKTFFPSLLTMVTLLGLLASAANASLVHDYEFNGNLNDSLGGPALVSLGGTIGASSYTFGAEQGLSLSNALTTPSTYTIDMSFEYDSLAGFRKILDFKNQASDNGLYNLSTDLNYFNFAFGPNGAFTAGTYARLDLTRDNTTGLVTGYVNGVAQISFTDSSSDATFTAANNIINFFQDDVVTGGRESSSGAVDQIRIWDNALDATQIAGLSGPSVPEPGTWLFGAALMCVGLVTRHRRQSAPASI